MPADSFASSLETSPAEVQPAVLQEINLAALRNGSDLELQKLSQVAFNDGFFYLDLKHPETQVLLEQVECTFRLAKLMFGHDTVVKHLFDIDKISSLKTNGYKPKGRHVVNKEGARDGHESWTLPRNGILNLGEDPFPHIPVVAEGRNALRVLLELLDDVAQTIFRSLSNILSLAPEHRLEAFHRTDKPSTSMLRLIKYEANARGAPHTPIIPHTDLGSLTFLFSPTPGLQVLPATASAASPREEDWMHITPKPGYAVVNFGDCLSMMTNGAFKSAVHRVGPLPGAGMPERYSIGYFVRPNDDTVLQPLASPLISSSGHCMENVTCAEWIVKKYKILRADDRTRQDDDQVIIGGWKAFA
ncbi:putative oxidoreductase [Nemania abortiva]|nr:putative oxidoreductase [Nemania abortiva]